MSQQASLFDQAAAGADRVVVRFRPDFAGWQAGARGQLAAHVAPDRLWWAPAADAHPPQSVALPGRRVPKAFVTQAKAASCHWAGDRWALLYALLWRLTHGEPHLMSLHGDAQVARLYEIAKNVRRDVHKMKAFVRFRAVAEPNRPADSPRYVAWFEPAHRIVEYTAPFFVRRFAGMRWSILTPVGCAHWDGAGQPWFSPGVDRSAAPDSDALEDAWRTYYRSISNPARVKLDAMRAEMPVKYWKNLPETDLIPGLVREAGRRVSAMEAQDKTEYALQCGPRPASPETETRAQAAARPAGSLERLALQAATCRNCGLAGPATQTVFGEGPADARVMLVGEQPGDAEDLAGRPFVGPAGQCLDRTLAEVGIDRRRLYVTNAVKHFKFRPRGRWRLHAKPDVQEIAACFPWLEAEIAALDPALIVCLGASAARAVLGRAVRLNTERGRLVDTGVRHVLVTYHPAYLLRLQAGPAAERARARFADDLAQAVGWVA